MSWSARPDVRIELTLQREEDFHQVGHPGGCWILPIREASDGAVEELEGQEGEEAHQEEGELTPHDFIAVGKMDGKRKRIIGIGGTGTVEVVTLYVGISLTSSSGRSSAPSGRSRSSPTSSRSSVVKPATRRLGFVVSGGMHGVRNALALQDDSIDGG